MSARTALEKADFSSTPPIYFEVSRRVRDCEFEVLCEASRAVVESDASWEGDSPVRDTFLDLITRLMMSAVSNWPGFLGWKWRPTERTAVEFPWQSSTSSSPEVSGRRRHHAGANPTFATAHLDLFRDPGDLAAAGFFHSSPAVRAEAAWEEEGALEVEYAAMYSDEGEALDLTVVPLQE